MSGGGVRMGSLRVDFFEHLGCVGVISSFVCLKFVIGVFLVEYILHSVEFLLNLSLDVLLRQGLELLRLLELGEPGEG